MSTQTASADQLPLRFDRSYDVPIQDLWELWTTKDGFEAWWPPEGFRVEVRTLDPREGGALRYAMIAVKPEHIEHLQQIGVPPSHEVRCTFVEVVPQRRLRIRHAMDFIAGREPYDYDIAVEFRAEGTGSRMLITLDAHPDPEWTRMAAQGMESQLANVPGALAARRR